MGFMDKAKAAAKAAKELKADLDKSGVLDTLKGGSGPSATATGGYPAPTAYPGPEPEPYVPRTRQEFYAAYGMVDPASLLTTDDVRRLTGVDGIGDPTESDGGDQALGLRWSGKYAKETYSFDLEVMFDGEQPGRPRDPAFAEELLGQWEGYDETEDVDGVGDRAFLMGNMLMFRKGGQALYVMAETPPAYAARRALEGLAREVATKLPG